MKTLKDLRRKEHLSQQELANAMNVSRSTVSMWERGTEPSNDMLQSLANYFHVSVDYLLGRNADPRSLFTCIKCGYPEVEDTDEYCRNCGHRINGNFCTNDLCVLNSDDENPVALPDTDCFCPECGSETTFYAQGLIAPVTYNRE